MNIVLAVPNWFENQAPILNEFYFSEKIQYAADLEAVSYFETDKSVAVAKK
jgi:hypothetical protein